MQQGELDIEQLLRFHGKDILHYIRFYSRNSNEAEDIFQEVFARAYQSRHSFRYECEPKVWLLRIAINACHNFFRWYKRNPFTPMSTVPVNDATPSAESEVMRNVDRHQLIEEILKLPHRYKDVVLLHYFEDQSVSEIAQTLDISESAVKVRLLRARKRLQTIDGGMWRGGTEGITTDC